MGDVNWWLMQDGSETTDGQRVELVGEWPDGETLAEIGFFVSGDEVLTLAPDEAAKMALEILRLALESSCTVEIVPKVKELHLGLEVFRITRERDKLAQKHFVENFDQLSLREKELIHEVINLRTKVKELEGERV